MNDDNKKNPTNAVSEYLVEVEARAEEASSYIDNNDPVPAIVNSAADVPKLIEMVRALTCKQVYMDSAYNDFAQSTEVNITNLKTQLAIAVKALKFQCHGYNVPTKVRAAAWLVVEHLNKKLGKRFDLHIYKKDEREFTVYLSDSSPGAECSSLPHAICLASLKAMGYGKEE